MLVCFGFFFFRIHKNFKLEIIQDITIYIFFLILRISSSLGFIKHPEFFTYPTIL